MMNVLKGMVMLLYHKIMHRGLVKMHYTSRVSKGALFEGANKVYPYATFNGLLGYGSYVGPNSSVYAKVGRFTSIAPFVKTVNGTHPVTEPYVSTSPVFYSLKKQNGRTYTKTQRFNEFLYVGNSNYPAVIGNDCWIGERAMIIGGVCISDGAIVLAGSIVTKDVPPYAIVGGVPAKIIKYRYSQDTILFLQNLKWWNMSEEWLISNLDLMTDIDLLKREFKIK